MKKPFLPTSNKLESELSSGVFRADRIKRIPVNLETTEFSQLKWPCLRKFKYNKNQISKVDFSLIPLIPLKKTTEKVTV